MIVKTSTFPSGIKENYLTLQIKCLFDGFKGSAIATNLWIQTEGETTTAIILRYGNTAFVSALNEGENEILEFLSALSFKNIITDKPFSFLSVHREDKVFKKALNKEPCPLPEIPSLKKIYETLSFGVGEDISLPPFEAFAPDTSHLLRHGFAFSVLEDFGGVYVHFIDGFGILKGISVNRGFRKKGLGSSLLKTCLDHCPKGLFIATRASENFYLKNGFLIEPYTIYSGELK